MEPSPSATIALPQSDWVATLALMNERAFSHSFASARRREDLVEVQQRLLVIWQRALGLPAE